MRYVAAYLLAVLGGNASPDLATIEKILSSVGVETDKTKAEKVISELTGKSIDDLLKQGSSKLASVPSGGGAAAAAPAAAAGAAAPAAESKLSSLFYLNPFRAFLIRVFCFLEKAEKKKEKTPEPSEDEDMGFGLFD